MITPHSHTASSTITIAASTMNRASTYVLYDGKQIIDHPVSALRSHPDIPVNTNKGNPYLISPRPTISLAHSDANESHILQEKLCIPSFSCRASQHYRRLSKNQRKHRGSFSQLMKQRHHSKSTTEIFLS